MMRRLSGQDASFLYSETPTVLMHTLKIQIFTSDYEVTDWAMLQDRLEATLDLVPMLRQRVMFVPFGLHHPVMVDDPDFDLDSHIYRAALPAPGGKADLHRMISQILCHRLGRQRPMWELWVITGLENGAIAIVHKVHHCLADGTATVRYLSKVFDYQAGLQYPCQQSALWSPKPLPRPGRLLRDALTDHLRYGIRRLPPFLATLWHTGRRLFAFNREVGSPTVALLANPPPRTRLNHALSSLRTFTTRQIPLAEVKGVARNLGGTVNDVILALAASALREYLMSHDDLPEVPLRTGIPVSADDPGADRESGNRTTYLATSLWTNIADPLERFHATRKSTLVAKQELQVMGKDTFVRMMDFLPPFISVWKTRRRQRLHKADNPDYRPASNVVVSNVPGPKERVVGNFGRMEEIFSMGPLIEGCGLNITVWSYAGNLNISLMGCKKAVPDIEALADGFMRAMVELEALSSDECTPQIDEDLSREDVA